MSVAPLARLAGEAFAMITGARLAEDKLDAPHRKGLRPHQPMTRTMH